MPPKATTSKAMRGASTSHAKTPNGAAKNANDLTPRSAMAAAFGAMSMGNGTPNGSPVAKRMMNGDGGSSSSSSTKRRAVDEIRDSEMNGTVRRTGVRGVPLRIPIPSAPGVFEPPKQLFVFGTGDNGQLGLGPDALDEIPRPRVQTWFRDNVGELARPGRSGGMGGLETVAAGGMHTLTVDENGRIQSWGINDNACLGRVTVNVRDPAKTGAVIPNEELESVPMVVEQLEQEGFRAVSVAAGDSVSVAVSDIGEVRAWGSFRSNDGVLGFDGVPGHSRLQFTPMAIAAFKRDKVAIVQVACGTDHVLALTTTGHVYVWGNGQQNQLGRRIIERRKINGLEPERLGLRNVVHVAAGSYHSFAIDVNGTVWAWGLNTYHQTGLSPEKGGDEEMVMVPAQVDALSPTTHDGARVVQISGGEHHSTFLFDNGEVWACGRSDSHQTGLGEDHPASLAIEERKEEARQAVALARQKVEELAAQGHEEGKRAAEAALANAEANARSASGDYVPEPVRVCFPPIPKEYDVVPEFPSYAQSRPQDNPIVNISTGTQHNLAVSKSGHLYSWGEGLSAQLGLGKAEMAEVPTLVRSAQLKEYHSLQASAGGQHCCVLAVKGKDDKGRPLTM